MGSPGCREIPEVIHLQPLPLRPFDNSVGSGLEGDGHSISVDSAVCDLGGIADAGAESRQECGGDEGKY
jgi:hypothetical protein